MFSRFSVILTIGFTMAMPLRAAEEWEECRSGPFEIYTLGAGKEARQLLVRLEQIRHVFGTLLGKQDPVSTWPMRVVLLKGKTGAPSNWTQGRDAWVSTLPAAAAVTPAWQREVVRMLLESNVRRMMPAWENGLLDFLSTLDAVGPHITLGTPPPANARTMDWARIHYLATDPNRTGRLRVLL